MACIGITASMYRAQSSNNGVHKRQSLSSSSTTHQAIPLPLNQKPDQAEEEIKHNEHSVGKFVDERWKNGTWDLNMFVKRGKMDWDSVIVAEARRRRFLQIYPEAASNEEPVLFRSSIVPWWAWITHSHLPQAELLNGRAAMVGFFTAYFVDGLTRLDVVGQTGNFICKVGLFASVIGVLLFRRSQDFGNLQKLADEATLYDRQWQASWQDPDSS
ncbi:hypothetical protein M9H77_10685 [Catharanthus roseus]|uniref:Uncharacterized protein n=1 Tax=Catharanthus roseus TaxID=4058 RepID=A0ACC0BCE4_CATRO|nr:hypothetical protein M9H77_10685 [Catharanthus roseus]